jgi:hypothetical protein
MSEDSPNFDSPDQQPPVTDEALHAFINENPDQNQRPLDTEASLANQQPDEPEEVTEEVKEVAEEPAGLTHAEIAENAGIDMTSHYESIRRKQEEVFREELAKVEEDPAQPETVEAVVNAIKTLCQESDKPGYREFSDQETSNKKLQRILNFRAGEQDQQLWMNYYPEGTWGVSPNVSQRAVVDLGTLHSGMQRINEDVGLFKKGDHAWVNDAFYVDKDTGVPKIARSISQINANTYSTGAERDATEEEVKLALDLVTQAAAEDTQIREGRRNQILNSPPDPQYS